MSTSVVQTEASMDRVHQLVMKIEPALEGEEVQHILLASLVVAIAIQHDGITPTQLAKGVKGASEWIALYLDQVESEDSVRKEVLN